MLRSILNIILAEKNILLVGHRDAGKSFFVQQQLIPFLQQQGIYVRYFKNMNEDISSILNKEVVVFDEFEVIEDKKFLERLHPEERPYYRKTYLEKVYTWLAKAKKISNKRIFIVTRDKEEVDNLLRTTDFEFADNVEVLEFRREWVSTIE